MQEVSLNGVWQLAYGSQRDSDQITPEPPVDWPLIPAHVPGNVELDLLRAQVIPDPMVGNNIYLLRRYETYEWIYTRQFLSPIVTHGQTVDLVLNGLDCVSDIWLNGSHIGHVENMLIPHRFNVTHFLSPVGEPNELAVCIRSAVLQGRQYAPEPVSYAFSMNWESLHVRKAPHMYGWDIMPRLVTAGIWRDISLVLQDATHWRSVYWATKTVDPGARTATILVDWDFVTNLNDVDALKVRVTIGKHIHIFPAVGTHGRATIHLENIDLWWPRGYGGQSLYEAVLDILDASDHVIATDIKRIGIRTAECRYTDITTPETPGEFVFIVNGERVFVKGTNWVPLDGFHSRDTSHLDTAMSMIEDLNCNMIRCWGGNVYEGHPFYNRCDELGVMVWQDFALACAIYPQTTEFADVIRREAECIVIILRNRPSLVLWAGNNEIDETYEWAGAGLDPNTDILSRQVLSAVIRRLDPFRTYLPSSPYSSPGYVREQKKNIKSLHAYNAQPEQHLWGPRTDFKGPFYVGSLAHFVSEIGYHGCPDRRSLEQFLNPAFVWPWRDNDQWITHATRPHPHVEDFNYRIQLMTDQIRVLFDAVPDTLDDYILASQIIQAEAMKFFIEWFRQAKWRRTGILWWNLRDGWPVISDAIVDYYNRRKLAYEYIKRVQTDVCVIVAEPSDGVYPIIAVNDTRRVVCGHALVHDADTNRIVFDADFVVESNEKATLGYVESGKPEGMWLIRSSINDMPMRNHYLVGKRPFNLVDYKRWLHLLDIPADVGPQRP